MARILNDRLNHNDTLKTKPEENALSNKRKRNAFFNSNIEESKELQEQPTLKLAKLDEKDNTIDNSSQSTLGGPV